MTNKNQPASPKTKLVTRQVGALHPRNRHHGRYDFSTLIQAEPSLAHLIITNPDGGASIDFADPVAVKTLNKALLHASYGIRDWDIPSENLCPPVPGRVDYLHYLADLLAGSNQGRVPGAGKVSALDIGTGASCIYPLLGASEYGWQFIASDINAASIANAEAILARNPQLQAHISLRLQTTASAIFKGIVGPDDWFDFSMCNPPFHQSLAEARAGSLRKWENLNNANANASAASAPLLNFSGHDAELWCEGGEQAFIAKMIAESAQISTKVLWFSTLVSKSASLPGIYAGLKQVKVSDHKTIIMSQGQKQSRLVAWTFLNATQQSAWAKLRWSNGKR
ncbi:23S rRNA (adenine(1618)-N(6))-methyltransferase RlmF [Undibacterium sp. TJN19]|uniref:23S rRNA (adenine(1618)-N(6))-methyltransferase RlmF n=1 Tax=Undibacterium sp. TJN19 TaxID=3413055 RepID=UPI003BEF68E6